MRHNAMIKDLLNHAGKFDHILEVDGFVVVAHRIDDLTAFCCPTLKAHRDFWRMDYDYGIVVAAGDQDLEQRFRANLERGKFVALPRTIPVENSMDMVVSERVLSPWLVQNMLNWMDRYTLPASAGLSSILETDDRLIVNLKTVYQGRFDDFITAPLAARVAN